MIKEVNMYGVNYIKGKYGSTSRRSIFGLAILNGVLCSINLEQNGLRLPLDDVSDVTAYKEHLKELDLYDKLRSGLYARLYDGKPIRVTIKMDCSCCDALNAQLEDGYLLLTKDNDNFKLDSPISGNNIVFVDDFDYIDMIVDEILD